MYLCLYLYLYIDTDIDIGTYVNKQTIDMDVAGLLFWRFQKAVKASSGTLYWYRSSSNSESCMGILILTSGLTFVYSQQQLG